MMRQAVAIGVAFLAVGCSRVPSYYTQRTQPGLSTSQPYAQPASRAVHPDEENPPRASTARRRAVPPAGQTPARSPDAEPDTETASIGRSEQREREIQRRMNSICTGC